MQSLESHVAQLFVAAIRHSFPSLPGPIKPLITPGRDVASGEFQCNNALQLPKLLKAANVPDAPTTPADVGRCVVQNLPPNDVIASTVVAPQGFINIKIAKQYVADRLYEVLQHGLRPPLQPRQRVLVDFSSPNIAKEMHVGHLRSTILGECLCRVFEFCGHDVLRINHVGDWGTQFGMLIAHLKDTFPDFRTAPPPIADLVAFYKQSKQRFDADPAFKERAHQEVVALQGGDADNLRAWTSLCAVSRVEFDKIYQRLGVQLTERGESFYNSMMPAMVEELLQRGLARVNEGATVIVSGDKKPLADLAPADVERILQYYFLSTALVDQPVLVECLKDAGCVKVAADGACALNIGTAKKEQLVPTAEISQGTLDRQMLGKVTKAMAESLCKVEKTKQGPRTTLQPGFVQLMRSVPELLTPAESGDVAFVPRFSHPFMIRKSDGGFSYDTTDLAALRYRIVEEKVDRVVYVTDLGQEGHFDMLFAAAEAAGYMDPVRHRCDHVGFGLVLGPDGKKLKTRAGETIRLVDLLDEAPRRSYEESVAREQEKHAKAAEKGETYAGLSEEELRANSLVLGYGAVKYFDLRQNRVSDYRFSYDDMLNLEGNTAVYLVYAYVRIRSIARRAGTSTSDDVLGDLVALHPEGLTVALSEEAEWTLGLHLLRFVGIVERLTEELYPNLLTDFLYQLVAKFNDYYNKVHILSAPDRDQKLLLCEAAATTLREGLRLLGLGVVDKI